MKNYKVIFLGSDSSGKTTLIKYTKKRLEEDGKSVDVIFMGWRNFYNPILRFFSNIYLKQKARKKVKEEKLARYKSRSWVFYFIYYTELWLRYLKVLLSHKDFILMDRYFYDELMFAKGSKHRFFKLITPRPDIALILKVPLNILKKRGENIKQQRLSNYYKYLDQIKGLCKTMKIDSSKPLNVIYRKIKLQLKNT